jgi:hypothetical protein
MEVSLDIAFSGSPSGAINPGGTRFPIRSGEAPSDDHFSLVVGAITHLVWDAFTHEETWAAQSLSFLRAPVWESGRPDPLQICDLLQFASSLFGFIFILHW